MHRYLRTYFHNSGTQELFKKYALNAFVLQFLEFLLCEIKKLTKQLDATEGSFIFDHSITFILEFIDKCPEY